MSDAVSDFIDDFLQHEYDPEKRREYYLRTRKLKGRKGKILVDSGFTKSRVGHTMKQLTKERARMRNTRFRHPVTPELKRLGETLDSYLKQLEKYAPLFESYMNDNLDPKRKAELDAKLTALEKKYEPIGKKIEAMAAKIPNGPAYVDYKMGVVR